jgi:hypothetical protein
MGGTTSKDKNVSKLKELRPGVENDADSTDLIEVAHPTRDCQKRP